MQDFLDQLGQRLTAMASRSNAQAPSPGRGRRRLPVVAGSATAILAGAGVFALTGTSAADLPILSTATTDATKVGERLPDVAKLGVDFSAAHTFTTPAGPGYVVAGSASGAVCIVLPDPLAAGEYGGSCAKSLTEIERKGLRVEFPGDRARAPDATTLSAFVLPDGAEDVRLVVDGRSSEPKIQSGVVVADLPTEGRLHWKVDGRPASEVLEGPFSDEGGVQTRCPDGRTVTIEAPTSGTALGQTIRKACAR